MKRSFVFVVCALLGLAVALPTSSNTPSGSDDDTLTAKDALETIKQAVQLIRDLTEDPQEVEASPRIGEKSQLGGDIKTRIKDISYKVKPSKYMEGIKGTDAKASGERSKDTTKVEKQAPRHMKQIAEDELGVLNEQTEAGKDLTTLLLDVEEKKQTNGESLTKADGDSGFNAYLGTKKFTGPVKKPDAHVITRRETAPSEQRQTAVISEISEQVGKDSPEDKNATSSGSPFNPINVIRGLVQPVVNAVNTIRDNVGVAFAPVVDALSPGKNTLKANESSVEESNSTLVDSDNTLNEIVTENVTDASLLTTSSPPSSLPSSPEQAAAVTPQTEAGSGSPFNPINAIRQGVNRVQAQIAAALSPAVDAVTPGKNSQDEEEPRIPEDPDLYVEPESVRQYTNYKLISTYIGNDTASLAAVSALQNVPKVDLWNHPLQNNNVTILLAPELSDKIEANLRAAGLDVTVLTDNLQSWLVREKADNEPGLFLEERDINNFAYDKYHSFEEISGYVDLIAQKYSNIATVRNLGVTQEGRPIKGIALSTGSNKPVVWIDGGIHAREWISPASVVYLLGRMASGFGTDTTVTKLLQTFDFYIFPVVNPDGYAYTFSSDRLWRKNRSGRPYSCRGVDPNRNFDTAFGGPGTSRYPCSDIYRGSYAFSEAESRAVRDGILQLGARVKAYVNVHSYSQLLMVPYGNGRGTYTRDYADQIAAARAASRAIQQKSGVYYQVGTISNLLGPAAGSSVDWAYDRARVKYSLAVELRDKGQHGFLLPNHLILPTAEEIFEGLMAFSNYIARRELNQEIVGSPING